MRLPDYLLTAIRQETAAERNGLAQASRQITHRYKEGEFSTPPVTNQTQRAAYLAVRLPATYAANWRVFAELRRLAPETDISSLLDLGAGPGTALFAAAEMFPELQRATLVDAHPQWLEMGKRLASASEVSAVRAAQRVQADLRTAPLGDQHDLVVISYALGELARSAVEKLVLRAWNCAAKFLVLIEPGTKPGFAVINAARSGLIHCGANILAPCPHHQACPMAAGGDWCHFSQRLERTQEHRHLKSGTLGYEDEKFSYLVATRLELPAAAARIVRHPRKHSGHVQLVLCKPGGLEASTVTKSQKTIYKSARQAEWGDAWDH